MDLDRTFWEVLAADHLVLLKNAVDWAADEPQPMTVTGPGMVDISYWRQKNSLAAHHRQHEQSHDDEGALSRDAAGRAL